MGIFDIFKAKWNHSNKEVRMNAVKEVQDQSILTSIAKTAKYIDSKKAAVRKIKDQNILAILAKISDNNDVALEAIVKLTDVNHLETIAKGQSDVSIRIAALKKLTDDKMLSLLRSFAKNDAEKMELREFAAIKLNDQDLLSAIVKKKEEMATVKRNTDDLEKHLAGISSGTFNNNPGDIFFNIVELHKKGADVTIAIPPIKLWINRMEIYRVQNPPPPAGNITAIAPIAVDLVLKDLVIKAKDFVSKVNSSGHTRA